MLGLEEILCELERDEMKSEQGGLPPGFRFHPTDEELVTFYLASKVFNGSSHCGLHIAELDLNRSEPWDLPETAKMGEREWYFFSLRDRKYPTGLRTNRATGAGYWKATGKDREVVCAASGSVVGMKKTLVFYKGRAPRGLKTKWVMHEYRLHGNFSCRHAAKEEWVVCRIFHKMCEKKSLMQGNSYLMRGCSSFYDPNSSLPPLLEPPPTLEDQHHQSPSTLQTLNHHQDQSPLLYHHNQFESDLKALINPRLIASQPETLPVDSSSVIKEDYSMFLKPFMRNQDLSSFKRTIARKCKSDLGTHNHNIQFLHQPDNSKNYQNPFVFGGKLNANMEIPSVAVDHHSVITAAPIDNVMSTEPACRWW